MCVREWDGAETPRVRQGCGNGEWGFWRWRFGNGWECGWGCGFGDLGWAKIGKRLGERRRCGVELYKVWVWGGVKRVLEVWEVLGMAKILHAYRLVLFRFGKANGKVKLFQYVCCTSCVNVHQANFQWEVMKLGYAFRWFE